MSFPVSKVHPISAPSLPRRNGRLDLFNIILIRLSKELPEHDPMYELHRLLGALLSQELRTDEKLSIMENEYDILAETDFKEDMNTICNLSEGIEEKGIAIGEAQERIRLILPMHNNGLTAQQIAEITEKARRKYLRLSQTVNLEYILQVKFEQA